MSKLIFLYLILSCVSAKAFDLSDMSGKITSFFAQFLEKKEPKTKQTTILMPEIPSVNTSATSTDTYVKKGVIYSQGKKFKKLDTNTKRQYQLSFLRELFKVTKSQMVSDSTLSSYLNILDQGGSREGLFRSIVLDRDYSSLEQRRGASGIKMYEYLSMLSLKYLNKDYKIAELKPFNKFSIKRIFVEKFLAVLDTYAFKSKPESIYSWYAHLSKELAGFNIWEENKTRKNSSTRYHYNWARNVPFEHIKSEVIIKFCSVIEHLATQK